MQSCYVTCSVTLLGASERPAATAHSLRPIRGQHTRAVGKEKGHRAVELDQVGGTCCTVTSKFGHSPQYQLNCRAQFSPPDQTKTTGRSAVRRVRSHHP